MNKISIIGENIKRIREHKRMTAMDVAQSAGVSNSTISQIEKGRRQTLQSDTLNKIATALGVTTNDLLGDTDTIKFETNDIIDVLNIINYADGITLDEIKLTDDEIQLLNITIQTTLNAIRFNRVK